MRDHLKPLLLAAGYLSLAGAALAAHRAPAEGYELSIYASTPTAVWVLLGGAFLVAIAVSIAWRDREQALGIVLGTAATTLLVALPVVRDYRYLGAGDALTHLGWARGVATGELSPVALLYPAIHTIAVELEAVMGGSLERGMLLVTVLFTVAYLVSVPMLIRRLTLNRWGFGLAAVSAWLLLPINNVGSHLMPFPTVQAIFFSPVVLFALLVFLERDRGDTRFHPASATVLLVLLEGALLIIHPQQAVNVAVILGAVFVTQSVFRRFDPEHSIASHRSVLVPTAALGVMLAVWIPTHPRSQSALSGVSNALLGGGTPGSVATVAQRSGSLSAIGAGVAPIFVKLFGVLIVYLLLSAVAIGSIWLYRTADRDLDSIVAYLSVAAFPLVALFAVYFVGTSTMAFRQVAFGGVIATILGAIQLSRSFDGLDRYASLEVTAPLAVVFLAVLVALSLATVFPSPFIVNPSGHVTDQQFDGYESAFDVRDPAYPIDGIRAGPERFAHGVDGLTEPTDFEVRAEGSGVPGDAFASGRLPAGYEANSYLIVTDADYQREAVLYRGLRYPKQGFERLDRQPGVDRVLTNGVFDLYVVDATPAQNASS